MLSGIQVGNELAFQPRDGVFQQQLALLHAGDLQLVAAQGVDQLFNGNVQVTMFLT
jgi:hypothetical protein